MSRIPFVFDMETAPSQGQFHVRFKDGTKVLLEVTPRWHLQMLMYTVRCTVLDLPLLEGWFIPGKGLRDQNFRELMTNIRFPHAIETAIKYRFKKNLLPALGV